MRWQMPVKKTLYLWRWSFWISITNTNFLLYQGYRNSTGFWQWAVCLIGLWYRQYRRKDKLMIKQLDMGKFWGIYFSVSGVWVPYSWHKGNSGKGKGPHDLQSGMWTFWHYLGLPSGCRFTGAVPGQDQQISPGSVFLPVWRKCRILWIWRKCFPPDTSTKKSQKKSPHFSGNRGFPFLPCPQNPVISVRSVHFPRENPAGIRKKVHPCLESHGSSGCGNCRRTANGIQSGRQYNIMVFHGIVPSGIKIKPSA
mgnify:CR=1 FL=1